MCSSSRTILIGCLAHIGALEGESRAHPCSPFAQRGLCWVILALLGSLARPRQTSSARFVFRVFRRKVVVVFWGKDMRKTRPYSRLHEYD